MLTSPARCFRAQVERILALKISCIPPGFGFGWLTGEPVGKVLQGGLDDDVEAAGGFGVEAVELGLVCEGEVEVVEDGDGEGLPRPLQAHQMGYVIVGGGPGKAGEGRLEEEAVPEPGRPAQPQAPQPQQHQSQSPPRPHPIALPWLVASTSKQIQSVARRTAERVKGGRGDGI